MTPDPYRRIARHYDAIVGRPMGILHRTGQKLCPATPGTRVLDVGCGTGLLLARYAAAGCAVHGIDLSPRMLARARARLGNTACLLQGDASRLPFTERSFDLVTACMALHEVRPEVRDGMLAEMARVVRDQGQVLLIDYHPGPCGFPRGWLNKALTELIELAAGLQHYAGFRAFLAQGGIPALAPAQGLIEQQRRVLGQGNVGLYRMQKSRA